MSEVQTTEVEVVEFKVARPTSRRGQVAEYMKEHASAPMLAVLPGIQMILAKDGKQATQGAARHFYVWCVEKGFAPGTPEQLPRTVKVETPAPAPSEQAEVTTSEQAAA